MIRFVKSSFTLSLAFACSVNLPTMRSSIADDSCTENCKDAKVEMHRDTPHNLEAKPCSIAKAPCDVHGFDNSGIIESCGDEYKLSSIPGVPLLRSDSDEEDALVASFTEAWEKENTAVKLTDLEKENACLNIHLECATKILELQKDHFQMVQELMVKQSELQTEVAVLKATAELKTELNRAAIEQAMVRSKLQAAQEWISVKNATEAARDQSLQHAEQESQVGYQCESIDSCQTNSSSSKLDSIEQGLAEIRMHLPMMRQTPVPFAHSESLGLANQYASSMPANFYSPSQYLQQPPTEFALPSYVPHYTAFAPYHPTQHAGYWYPPQMQPQPAINPPSQLARERR